MTTPKPLLLLDVDGPLNPYRQLTRKGYLPPKQRRGEEPFLYDKHLMRPTGWETGARLPVLISPEMGQHLRALAEVYTLIWATTWVEDANRLLSPLLGLPTLPVIEWPGGGTDGARDWAKTDHHGGSWKSKWIARWIDDYARYTDSDGNLRHVPWVWIDDEINQHDRAYFRAHYGEARTDPQVVRRWLLRIEPSHGLRRNDFADLRQWADEVACPDGSVEDRNSPAPR